MKAKLYCQVALAILLALSPTRCAKVPGINDNGQIVGSYSPADEVIE